MAKFDNMLIVSTREYKQGVQESYKPYTTLCIMKRRMREMRNRPVVDGLISVLHHEDALADNLNYTIASALKLSRLDDYLNPTV